MPESFNSPAHAKSFLKRRGLYLGPYMGVYALIARPTSDMDEREAIRYLKRKGTLSTIDQRVIYDPQ